jgi:hypothetical protein
MRFSREIKSFQELETLVTLNSLSSLEALRTELQEMIDDEVLDGLLALSIKDNDVSFTKRAWSMLKSRHASPVHVRTREQLKAAVSLQSQKTSTLISTPLAFVKQQSRSLALMLKELE